MGEDENVLENLEALQAAEHAAHPLLKAEPGDSEAVRVVKRLINWYWGYDKEEGSQEITDVLYKFGLSVEPDEVRLKDAEAHRIELQEKDNLIKFYKDKAAEYLERAEGLQLEMHKRDPNNKYKTREASSLAKEFPYADAKLRKEVERSNARESAVIDALVVQQTRYDDLLSKYWKLKSKYEPEKSSDGVSAPNDSASGKHKE